MEILEIEKAYLDGRLTKEQAKNCLLIRRTVSMFDEAIALRKKENISFKRANRKIQKRYSTLHF